MALMTPRILLSKAQKRLTDYGFRCEHSKFAICIYDEELFPGFYNENPNPEQKQQRNNIT